MHYNYKIKTILLFILLILTVAIAFFVVLFPKLFWDEFLLKYYWATIEADAIGSKVKGIGEEYNPVNTLTYSLILVGVLYIIYREMKKRNIEIDTMLFFSFIPYILLGGALRALEDAGMFHKPFVYLFISPIIYILLGLPVIFLLFLSFYIEKNYTQKIFFLFIIGIFIAINTFFSFFLSPIVSIAISIAILMPIYFVYKIGKIRACVLIFSTGMFFLLIALYIISNFLIKNSLARPLEIPIIISYGFFITSIIFLPFYLLRISGIKEPYTSGINLTLLFGHVIDAASTYRGMEIYGYVEKHVLPTFLINLTGMPAIMLLIKPLLILVVIYIIDVEYEDVRENKELSFLLKLCILVLGLAPGIRDMLRIAMGV
ncbi:MAG: DUF63 family protein [Candidatus Thermoplasmatota archaeon]